MKFHFVSIFLLGLTPLHSAISPVNLGFEDLSGTFPTGWTTTGTVTQTAGLGSPIAASLAAGATLHQDFAPTLADGLVSFSTSFTLRLDGSGAIATNTSRVRFRGNNNAGDLLTLRLSSAGLECATNGTWAILAPFANQLGTAYDITLEAGEFDGDAALEYRVTCSDGTNTVTSAVQNVWHGTTTTATTPFETIRFEAGTGNTLSVDNIALQDSTPPSQWVANPGFEILPFPSSWTSSGGTVSTTGLNGTATAARLPYNTSASLQQGISGVPADFTADLSFQVAGTGEAQALRWQLGDGVTTVIDLRTATGGTLQLNVLGEWLPMLRLTDDVAFNVTASQTVRLRVIGRNFGTPAASYDIVWSDPGSTSLTHAATGITTFASAGVPAAPPALVRFVRDVYSGNSFLVDDVTLLSGAATPPAADYRAEAVLPPTQSGTLEISGIYPHLALTHAHPTELGISGVVPWAGKLWAIEYFAGGGNTDGSPHLFSIEDDLTLTPHGKYYGGSIASRLIHDNKLILGPYIIDNQGAVREWRVHPDMGGGHVSAVAKDLNDPDKINVVGLSNERWSIDLSGTTNPLPAGQVVQQHNLNAISSPKYGFTGKHGKGARTGQGVTVYGSNGEGSWPGGAGSLFEWTGLETGNVTNDLSQWKLVERIQINEITGPGGILGEVTPDEPMWAMGWDHRSVVLMCRDAVTGWHKYRFPKASHTHDHVNGWHVEWPRIRDVGLASGRFLMNQHGLMYEFPATFSPGNTGGIRPLSTFHKMIVDYADWNGRIIMGCNDTSKFSNELLHGRVNSNFVFMEKDGLPFYGERPEGIGSVWYQENVAANPVAQSPTDLVAPTRNPSDPMFVSGFTKRVLHLSHGSPSPVDFTVQIDATGSGSWSDYQTLTVPANGYVHLILPESLNATWARLATTTNADNVSATFYLSNPRRSPDPLLTEGLAEAAFTGARSDGFVRSLPSTDYTAPIDLEFAANIIGSGNTVTSTGYYRVDKELNITPVTNATAESALRAAAVTSQDYQVDAASVIIDDATYGRVRLPKGSSAYDSAGPTGWFRGRREVVTERAVMNIHGTFYELPRSDASSGGIRRIRPITTHNKLIRDFCSWRGLLVLSGLPASVSNSEHVRVSSDGQAALWFGNIDDLWRFGQPAGIGGPWMNTAVAANTSSDPYLMRGYDTKTLEISHDSASPVDFTVQVDVLGNNTWRDYGTFTVAPGTPFTHVFPDGYSAYWVRLTSANATTASAQFTYGIAPGSAFFDWMETEGISSATADDDHDGLPPLIEYAFGRSTSRPDVLGDAKVLSPDGAFLTLIVRDNDPDLEIVIETSTTLEPGSWQTLPGSSELTSVDQTNVPAGMLRRVFELPFVANGNFARTRVQIENR
jgi:hypothetical protein